MLYIVATPIGNLKDISLRALEVLKSVDLVVCEDTRTSGVLLKHYGIEVSLRSFHAFSDEKKVDDLIDLMAEGKNLALISDAGTPGISDPGFKLVSKARAKGIKVVPVPGASAFLCGLQASGLPINQFVYLGFLPMKKGRKSLLESIKEMERTVVFYESVHRINKTLLELEKYLGADRFVCVGRELTKMFEEFYWGKISEIIKQVGEKKLRGEFVIMVAPEWYS